MKAFRLRDWLSLLILRRQPVESWKQLFGMHLMGSKQNEAAAGRRRDVMVCCFVRDDASVLLRDVY